MFNRLFPRKFFFFEFFEKHAAINVEAVQKLIACISSNMNPAWILPIKDLEHQADGITRSCAEALHVTFITPFDRDQIHALITKMDDITDCIDAAADMMIIYKIDAPTPDLFGFASLLEQSVRQIQNAVTGLRNLKNSQLIQNACLEINRIEHEADALLRHAISKLFDDNSDARTIIKWKEIYESLEGATDRCADVADVIVGILLEND
jgi:predicted phosphate transport protein (TIGR00153 family)